MPTAADRARDPRTSTVPAVTREQALMLACARTTIDGAAEARVRALLEGPLDWDALVREAELHQVSPLLARHLAGRFAAACPEDVVVRLRTLLLANAARNLLLADLLVQAMRLLAAHGIRAIAYKGPLLAHGVYGDLALRWFGDADVLVHPYDYRFTVPAVLAANGWEPGPDRGFERTWRKGALRLDVHQSLTPPRLMPFVLSFADAWRRRASLALPGGSVPTFAPEDLLLVLCVQLAKDSAEERRAPILIKVCDVAELVQRMRPEALRRAVRRARRLGVHRIVQVGAAVAHRLLGMPVPAPLAPRARRASRVDAPADHVRERLLGRDPRASAHPEWLELSRWNATLRERMRDRSRVLVELRHHVLAANPSDHAYVRLPRVLWPLYAAVRPVRLAHKFASRALRGARCGDAQRPA